MKKFKLLGLLVGTFALGGCMATISPDGAVTAGYVVPAVSGVVVTHHYHHRSRPIVVAKNHGRRPPARHAHNHYRRPGPYRPR